MKKQVFCGVFALALAVTGCGAQKKETASDIVPENRQELTILHVDAGTEGFDSFISQAEKDLGMKIHIEKCPANADNRQAKIATLLTSGDDSVDLITVNDEMISEFKHKGFLLPLEDTVMTEETAANFLQEYLKEICMSDLTDMGYIVQPHTSAGRIPSDKGYRLYVNELMKEKEAEVAELRDLIIEKTDKMDKVLKKVAKVLASNTNYATMVSVPQYSGNKIKFIQLSRMSELQLVAVVVSDNNTVRNQIINLDEEMDDQTILKLNLLLNTNLNGIPIQDINLGMIARLKEQAGSHSGVVATVLDAVAATIHVEEEDMEIYTSGATNIFKYPELADKEKATELISAFEEKHELADLVKEQMSDGENTGIQVYIGDEMPIQTMKDCSIVTARYELGDGMYGTIGIIGPKRMDYENVVDSLKELKNHLDDVLKKKKT